MTLLQALAACCTRHQQLQAQYMLAEAAVLQSTVNADAASPGEATCAPTADAALLLGSIGSAADALTAAKQSFLQRLEQSKAAARYEDGDTADAMDTLSGGDAGEQGFGWPAVLQGARLRDGDPCWLHWVRHPHLLAN